LPFHLSAGQHPCPQQQQEDAGLAPAKKLGSKSFFMIVTFSTGNPAEKLY